tara:strand:+ start:245695 stop:247896 length:2202 start_codon:yes stop_codon:yes gene_type:complete
MMKLQMRPFSSLSLFKLFLPIIFLASPAILSAQDKMLSMKDAIVGSYTNLRVESLSQFHWIPNSSQFSYIQKDKGENLLLMANAQKPKRTKKVLSLSDFNEESKSIIPQEFKRFPRLDWKSETEFQFEYRKKLFAFDLSKNKLRLLDSLELPQGAQNRQTAPKTNYIAFTVDHHLFLLKGDKVIPVSENLNSGIVSGQTVSRSEFGITNGIFWSPDGKKLAYYIKDESIVTDYPIVNWNDKPATVDFIKYPMAGTKRMEKVSLHVYHTETGENKMMQTGPQDSQYLTNIAWDPKSEKIYIAHLNRDQNHMEMKRYNAASGEFEKLLFEEKSSKYVEPLQPVHFVKGNDEQFIWESSRSGFNHLYLYSTDGQLLKTLTKGNWELINFYGFNNSGSKAFFSSTAESDLNRDLYSVNLDDGKIKRLTKGQGTHSISLSPNADYFLDNFSNIKRPRISSIVEMENLKSTKLLQAENPLEDYALGEMRFLDIKDKDGGNLHCRMYLPNDFDSTKSYPVLVYLYGGPHAQMIRNTWNGGGNLWFQYMAQQGYIVWTLDNRGSGNRGLAWEQNTFRQLGTVEMEDQMQGIEYLKSKSYVDADRIGIHGWSFGGFMTMSLMSRYPGVFKVGVAGGPVIDWSYYEVMYTERYMDSPEQNPEGYSTNNLINHIDSLDGKLMIIHGTSDDVVLWQHSQIYLKETVKKKKQLDYFVYPMHKHNVRGYDRIHLMQKVSDYFEDYLK